MEAKIIRALVTLGVPGVALGIFYLLLRGFDFQLSQIDPATTGILAVLFLLIAAGITAYALHLWRPFRSDAESTASRAGVLELNFGGEKVVLREVMHSLAHDVIKIEAHTHGLGVAAEYAWIDQKYPKSERISQALVNMEISESGDRKIYFDLLKIELPNGNVKELYFDISSFFGQGYSSLIDPESYIAHKIRQLYR